MEYKKDHNNKISNSTIVSIWICISFVIFEVICAIFISLENNDKSNSKDTISDTDQKEYNLDYINNIGSKEIPKIGTELGERKLYGRYIIKESTISDYSAVAVTIDQVIFVTSDGIAEIYDKAVDFYIGIEFDYIKDNEDEYKIRSYQEIDGKTLNSIIVNRVNYGDKLYTNESNEYKYPNIALYLSEDDNKIISNISVIYTISN